MVAVALPGKTSQLCRSQRRKLATEGQIMSDSELSGLNAADFRILRELVGDGRASDVSLSERVHLSSTAAARRRKVLEERGLIKGYTAELDTNRLGFSIGVLVQIELSSQAEQVLNEFEEAVVRCPSMSFCSFVSGETDFIMMIHVRSFEDYDRVYRKELSTLPHVARIRSSFLMREVAQRRVAPVVLGESGR
jgi:Lrp/AsnC family leucine-responsive transcriptional regulator